MNLLSEDEQIAHKIGVSDEVAGRVLTPFRVPSSETVTNHRNKGRWVRPLVVRVVLYQMVSASKTK